jgi:hypothetical protein
MFLNAFLNAGLPCELHFSKNECSIMGEEFAKFFQCPEEEEALL